MDLCRTLYSIRIYLLLLAYTICLFVLIPAYSIWERKLFCNSLHDLHSQWNLTLQSRPFTYATFFIWPSRLAIQTHCHIYIHVSNKFQRSRPRDEMNAMYRLSMYFIQLIMDWCLVSPLKFDSFIFFLWRSQHFYTELGWIPLKYYWCTSPVQTKIFFGKHTKPIHHITIGSFASAITNKA